MSQPYAKKRFSPWRKWGGTYLPTLVFSPPIYCEITSHFYWGHTQMHKLFKTRHATYEERNNEARSSNYFGREKSKKCYVICVFVALGVQQVKRMRCIILSSVVCCVYKIFHIISKTARFSAGGGIYIYIFMYAFLYIYIGYILKSFSLT